MKDSVGRELEADTAAHQHLRCSSEDSSRIRRCSRHVDLPAVRLASQRSTACNDTRTRRDNAPKHPEADESSARHSQRAQSLSCQRARNTRHQQACRKRRLQALSIWATPGLRKNNTRYQRSRASSHLETGRVDRGGSGHNVGYVLLVQLTNWLLWSALAHAPAAGHGRRSRTSRRRARRTQEILRFALGRLAGHRLQGKNACLCVFSSIRVLLERVTR